MKNTHPLFLWAILALLLPLQLVQAANLPTELQQKLQGLPGISDIKAMESDAYPEKYVFFINQLLDPHHPEAGNFKQRVILSHVGFDRPTVLVTEGYAAHYATSPRYQEELARIFNANLIFVEYRYFGESMPEPCNWDYLTVENSLYDLHNITTTLKQLYAQKWISTGISKGGQTTMFYRAYFPDDVDISIPYVAPLNKSLEDGRHEPFIAGKVSTAENRKRVQDFQLEVLKRKDKLMPMFEKYCTDKGYTFRIPVAEVYDFNILEYSFALWQWGTPVSNIPATSADDKSIFNHFIAICEPDYFSEQSPYPSFNVQAAKELGYYGYDIKPFKKYLTIKTSKDYLRRVMLPAELSGIKFDATLYKKVVKFLKENDPEMIYIYGGDDPWTASGVTWLKDKKNIKVYVLPGGSHRTRIGSFDTKTQEEIKAQIKAWLDK
ncbi:MAG: aminopeptidase [Bacteroides sp.]|nr:aminopeptidase [Bacteroides sp.]